MESELSRLLDTLPAMVWTARRDGTTDFVNQHWLDYTGMTLAEGASSGWTTLFHPEDLSGALAAWDSTLSARPPDETTIVARLKRADGLYRRCKIQIRPLKGPSGAHLGWCGINTDIEDQSRAEAQLAAEKRLLELIARGIDLPGLLRELCAQVEGLFAGSYCSIIFVDEDGRRFRVGAGESLPAEYNAILDGLKIDPGYGPCSLAVETQRTVIVTDPQNDRRWRPEGWPAAMSRFGLVSCWSTPIFGSRNEVLGIFAIYRREPVGPTAEEQELIDRFTKIAGIGCERARSDAALKAREADLRRANHFLNGAQRLSKTGSFSLDTVSDEQVWSDENYRLWEFDPATAPNMDLVAAAIHPDDREATLQAFAEATRAGGGFEVFYRIVTPSAGVKHVHTVMEVMSEIPDRLVYLGTTQDITESKLAQAELARANTYLLAAQNLSQTGSFTWDVAADEHNWSEVIYRVFGFESGVRVTMDMMMDAIHPEDIPQVEALIGGAQIGENFELAFRIITPDGKTRHAHVMGHRIDNIPDRPVFMGALQDITSRKLAEDDLNHARAQLAHMARVTALSTLTASIAHEVSQPLAGIITNANTCLRMLATDPPNIEVARATAQRTLRDSDRASEVIKRLRALFTRKPPSLEEVDLEEAVREVLTLSASELQRRRVTLRTDFEAPPLLVTGDRVQLQQVVLNLILNAADAMADLEGCMRDLRVSAGLTPDDLVILSVSDAGPGIDPAKADRLFEPFHSTKPDGMGIGLSISRSIIEAHGGRIWGVSSPERPGATFSFTIPRAAPAAQSVLRQA